MLSFHPSPVALFSAFVFPFSRWREKVPKADEGGVSRGRCARSGTTLARRADARRPLPPAGEVNWGIVAIFFFLSMSIGVPALAAQTQPTVAAPSETPPPDSKAQAVLAQLDDIVTPAPPDWWPHTWGWAVLGFLVLALLLWVAWHVLRRHRANRYRREALAELTRVESQLGDDAARATALAKLPPLLKRTALAAWPRDEVARLSGRSWRDFLGRQTKAGMDPAVQRLLDDLEYRGADTLRGVPEADARAAARAVRRWIETHRAVASRAAPLQQQATGRTHVPA
jgi:hypothetical protein